MIPITRRQFTQSGTLALAVGALGGLPLIGVAQAQTTIPPPDATIHVLNRISFGIRPENLERIQSLGIAAYIEEQLYPEQIDDSEVEDFIAEFFPTVHMTIEELSALSEENPQQAVQELRLATLYRGLFSRRQLYEMMVDFWSNHFNVYHLDGPVNLFKTVDDREVIRRHAMGYFRAMLHASAKSPAMLYYLDNYTNTNRGPNENYARELMELHTLAVDGGYTETDVLEVARCFTGWSIDRGANSGNFRFYPRLHDSGEKIVLNTLIPAGQGVEDGEQVLDLLSFHPATAKFIATKLCRRFVADDPPAALVDKVAQDYASNGDIRQMLRTLLLSDAFMQATDAKFKRPLELVLSMLRATEVDLPATRVRVLVQALNALGQIPFNWHPPNGYPDVMGYWANTNSLLNRWNLGIALGERSGVDLDLEMLPDVAFTAAQLVDYLSDRLLHRQLTAEDRDTFIHYASDGAPANAFLTPNIAIIKAQGLIGLMLGSLYFQMR